MSNNYYLCQKKLVVVNYHITIEYISYKIMTRTNQIYLHLFENYSLEN